MARFLLLWAILLACVAFGGAVRNDSSLHWPRAGSDARGVGKQSLSGPNKCTSKFKGSRRKVTVDGRRAPKCKGRYMKIRNNCKDKKVYFEKTKTSGPVEWKIHQKRGSKGYEFAFEPMQAGCKGLYLNLKRPSKVPTPGDWSSVPVEAYLSKKSYFSFWTEGEDEDSFDAETDCRPEIVFPPKKIGRYAFGISEDCDGFVLGNYEDGEMPGHVPLIEF